MATMVVDTKDAVYKLEFRQGQNSLGEPGMFLHKPPYRFRDLNGWPDYAVEQRIVDMHYTYSWGQS